MRKTKRTALIATALCAALLSAIIIPPPHTLQAAGKTKAAAAKVQKLPEYDHEYEGELMEEVYDYVEDKNEDMYDKADVGIPCPIIIAVDQTDPDDIKVYGDFQYWTYKLNGDTLETQAGGSYPGLLHLRKEKDGDYDSTKFEAVEDGSKFDESAKKIFGDKYDAFMKVYSDDEAKDAARNQILANYAALNNLSITKVKDYGADAVTLPEANMDKFSSIVEKK